MDLSFVQFGWLRIKQGKDYLFFCVRLILSILSSSILKITKLNEFLNDHCLSHKCQWIALYQKKSDQKKNKRASLVGNSNRFLLSKIKRNFFLRNEKIFKFFKWIQGKILERFSVFKNKIKFIIRKNCFIFIKLADLKKGKREKKN